MLKVYKPTSDGIRERVSLKREDLTLGVRPEKSLLKGKSSTGGRNNTGRITCWQRGGGHKRRYRKIDFKRDKIGIPGKIKSIEYDPNRNVNIALVNYIDGEKRYILAPLGIKIGDPIESGEEAEIKLGNALPLKCIPEGTLVHNIELKPQAGGKLVRSAGAAAILLGKDKGWAQLRLPSGEIRLISEKCFATIGQLGNIDYKNIKYGKGGAKRHLGRRPNIRGVATNPVDHPLGGGEGKTGGGRHPTSPWGKLAKGYKTRKKNKLSNKYIIKRRKG
jgi:large subunit ribosomal protein L2